MFKEVILDIINIKFIWFFFLFYFITLILVSMVYNIVGLYCSFLLIMISLVFLFFILIFNLYNVYMYSIESLVILNIFKSIFFFKYYLSYKICFLSYSFLFLIIFIGLSATTYTFSYFKDEPEKIKFIILLNWFILSMSLLVLSNNLISLLIGWELIGITSFFLINFWHLKVGVIKSAFKAFIFNKLSDFFLIFSFIIFLFNFKTINIDILHIEGFNNINSYNIELFLIFIIITASFKTTQVPLHLWLPDSMEAPIPASSLIHSATLVSAGIFLLLLFNKLFMFYTNLLLFINLLGSITACYGGFVASVQTDKKKILAYSTISHCGYMFVCFSLSNLTLTITYIYLHGLFKALVFFLSGYYIKLNNGLQDLRQMGQYNKYTLFENYIYILAVLNLCCLPFTVGFYFKYNLIMSSFYNRSSLNIFLVLSLFSSFIYGFKLIKYTLFSNLKIKKQIYVDKNKKLLFNKNLTQSSTNLKYLFLVYILFIYLFYFIYWQYLLNYLNNGLLLTFNNNDSNFYKILNKDFFFYIYYNLLLIIYLMLSNFTNNYEYYKIYKINYILFIFLFLFFFNIFILFIMCGIM